MKIKGEPKGKDFLLQKKLALSANAGQSTLRTAEARQVSKAGRAFSLSPSRFNWLTPMFRIYVLKALSNIKEIRCEKCGAYSNLEMHHKKYAPKQKVTIYDIQLLCGKCHRNSRHETYSKVATVFIKGKRYCVTSNFKFPY